MKKQLTLILAFSLLALTAKLFTSSRKRTDKFGNEFILKDYHQSGYTNGTHGHTNVFTGNLTINNNQETFDIPIFFIKSYTYVNGNPDHNRLSVYAGLGSAVGEPEDRNRSNAQTIKLLTKKKLNPVTVESVLMDLVNNLDL